jgi:hypothetical protein
MTFLPVCRPLALHHSVSLETLADFGTLPDRIQAELGASNTVVSWHCQLERDQHDLVGSCKLGEFILGSIFGLNSEPQLAAALSPCTSFAQVDNAAVTR